MIWGDKRTPYGPLNKVQPLHHVYPTHFTINLDRPAPENSPNSQCTSICINVYIYILLENCHSTLWFVIWGDKRTPYGPLNKAQPSHHVYPTQFGINLYRSTPENPP